MVRVIGVAADAAESPACDAVMVHVPTASGLTVPLVSSEHTADPLVSA